MQSSPMGSKISGNTELLPTTDSDLYTNIEHTH